MNEALAHARELLAVVTPLNSDCGRICAAACCKGNENDGMLLFPHEEDYYTASDWAKIIKSPVGSLLVCEGSCPREQRPLACRMFPLRISFNGDKPFAVLDIRAWAVCPLMNNGLTGLSQSFTDAVTLAGEVLAADEEQLEHLHKTEELAAQYENLGSSIGI